MIPSKWRELVGPVYLLACLLLGGSTQTIWLAASLQLCAVFILAWALIEGCAEPVTSGARQLALLLIGMLVLAAIQLFPLPPIVWTQFPGRERVISGLALLNLKPGWQSLSLAPYETLTTILPLLPPLAIVAAIMVLRAATGRGIAIALFLGAVFSFVLGLLQINSANLAGSNFYLQVEHNDGKASGFFANSNHFATLLLINIPFLVALISNGVKSNVSRRSKSVSDAIVGLSGLALVMIGLVVNGSLAGLGLAIPITVLSLYIVRSFAPVWRGVIATTALFGLVGFLLIIFSPTARQVISKKDSSSITTRAGFNLKGWSVAREYFPVGAGLGTFQRVYRAEEDPRLIEPGVYVNHAHNDYLELLIETGLAGLVLISLFVFFWARSIRKVLIATVVDRYALAGSVATVAILAHSIVDYPLRTSAISACFAASLALIVLAPRSQAGANDLRPTRNLTIE